MAGTGLPVAAEQGVPGCAPAAGEAGGAPGAWGTGEVGTLELEPLWAGRKAGSHQRTPSEKQRH